MKKSLYFPNLNGLRFFAAFLVLIHHIEQNKSIYNLPSFWNVPAIELMGKLGVVLFFVLSGYLITFLLLEEKRNTGSIQIKNFYIRRILRIWPLYYFVIILAFFIIPHISFLDMSPWTDGMKHHFWFKVTLFFMFLPNLALSLFARIPYAAQAWSIGVEEQFYLMWPFLVKKSKRIHWMLIGVISFYVILKLLLVFLVKIYPSNEVLFKFSNFWYYSFTIDCMAFGGLAAYIRFYNKEKILKVVFNKVFQVVIYAITLTLLFLGMRFPRLTYEVYSLLFSIIIINLASNPKTIVSIEYKWLDYLGKVSYGIYMYHILMSSIAIKLCIYFKFTNNIVIYISSIALSLLVSILSYEYFEKRFIKAKIKYSTVVSGDNVKDNVSKNSKVEELRDEKINEKKEQVAAVV